MNPTIEYSLNMLLTKDEYLLVNNVHERTITHKIGEYLQQILPEWNVDCEYDRLLDGPKRIGMSIEQVLDAILAIIEAALTQNKITINEKDELVADVARHKEYIRIYGENIPYNVVASLYRQLKSGNIFHDDLRGILQVAIKKDHNSRDTFEVLRILPDVIVHHRGTEENLIAIEAKKSTSDKNEAWLFDYLKLIALTDAAGIYKYQFGYFLNIPAGEHLLVHRSFNIEKFAGFTKVYSR